MKNISRQKERLDLHLARRGYVSSRDQAKRFILAGAVSVNGQLVDKVAFATPTDALIDVNKPNDMYVSRGGVKLAAALDALCIESNGTVVLDVGASTGGFTDCVLQRGAKKVYAVDVGYGQLAWKLQQDQRVIVLDRRNIRYLPDDCIPELIDLVTIDVSFISLKNVLPRVREFVKPGGDIIALVKPQFEVGKGKVGRGGIVRDPQQRDEVVAEVISAAHLLGLHSNRTLLSPITGRDGNVEIFVHLTPRLISNTLSPVPQV
tara:strand:+ start:1224 stop:2009 length:786 start_codon:yes stop_codon:yes gene_type:complete